MLAAKTNFHIDEYLAEVVAHDAAASMQHAPTGSDGLLLDAALGDAHTLPLGAAVQQEALPSLELAVKGLRAKRKKCEAFGR